MEKSDNVQALSSIRIPITWKKIKKLKLIYNIYTNGGSFSTKILPFDFGIVTLRCRDQLISTWVSRCNDADCRLACVYCNINNLIEQTDPVCGRSVTNPSSQLSISK